MSYPATPELDKMIEVQDKSQAISEFIEWMQNESGLSICRWENDARLYTKGYWQVETDFEGIMARFFGIDLKAADRERKAILAYLRERNQQ